MLASGSNLGLLVLYTAFDATSTDARVTGVTWNISEVFTKINDSAGITSDAWNGAWFLPNPTPTTANIVLTFAGITTEQNALAISGSGIDQTTANHKYIFGGTLTDIIALAQATGIASGDYAGIIAYAEGATSGGTPIAVTPDGATTEICDQSYGSGDHSNWGGRGAVTGAVVTLGGTITGSGLSKDWEGVMVVLLQSGAAPASDSPGCLVVGSLVRGTLVGGGIAR